MGNKLRHLINVKLHIAGILVLILVTLLWGTSFIVIKETVATIPASVLVFTRFGLAAILFLPFLQFNRQLFQGSLEIGLWIFAGYGTQTLALQYTTVNRNAFITTLYVVILPLLLGLLGRHIKWQILITALLAAIGIGLLSYENSPPNLGDAWSFATALSWVMYIWRLETYANKLSSLSLTGGQLLATAGFSLLWVGVSNRDWLTITTVTETLPWMSLLYLGIITTAITTWMQTWGQARISAPEAALIYPLEPVWASLFAYSILGEKLGIQGLVGAVLIIGAIIISQFIPMSQNSS
ncbi:MAG: EamA family transporter [Calothrix sp. MO_167.B12]|nr:EamA family transporter [Calothrix sp. MO_167.B12]